MIPYLAILKIRVQTLLQYRAAALAGLGTQWFFGLMMVYVYEAFYAGSGVNQPMSLTQVITYIWLGQALLGMLPWNLDPDVKAMIRSGNVAYELVRPMDLYSLWFSRGLALRTAPTVMRAAPMVIMALLWFGMRLPPSWPSAAAWVAATIGALLLSCAITTLLNISILWTVSGEGIAELVVAFVILFSGMVVPLPLFPDWAQAILNLLPFRGLVDLPFRLYIGHIPPEGLGYVLMHQAVWTLTLVMLGRFLLACGLRRVVVQGG